MRRLLTALLLALVSASAAQPAQAQLAFRGVEFWGGQYAWSGDQVERLDAGFQGGFGIWGELGDRVGLGLEGITGGFDSNSNDPQTELRWDDVGLNGVVRFALLSRVGFHPFLEARFGWTRISSAQRTTTEVFIFEEDGLSYGGELGVEIPLNRRARIVAAGGVTRRDYGDADLVGSGIPETQLAGTRWGFRFGIALGRAVD